MDLINIIYHKKFIDKIVKLNNSIRKNNIYDGSTNLSKIPTEFGVFGLILIILLIYNFLKKNNYDQHDYFIISLICLQFLRGVGYFNSAFILFLLVYFLIIYKKDLFEKK